MMKRLHPFPASLITEIAKKRIRHILVRSVTDRVHELVQLRNHPPDSYLLYQNMGISPLPRKTDLSDKATNKSYSGCKVTCK
jgi:hypothetical protein